MTGLKLDCGCESADRKPWYSITNVLIEIRDNHRVLRGQLAAEGLSGRLLGRHGACESCPTVNQMKKEKGNGA